MKKLTMMVLAMAVSSAFAEMGLPPINQLIGRGKAHPVLVAHGVRVADITRVAGYMAGTDMGANAAVAPVSAEGYFPAYRNDGKNTGLGFELQAWSEARQQTVSANIFFYEEGGDLYVYLYQFKVRANAVAAQSLYSSGSYLEPSTRLDGKEPCLCGLRVWIAGRDRVADYGYWKSSNKELWTGTTPERLTDFEGILTGGYRPYLMHVLGYNESVSAGAKSVQLQAWGTNDMTRALHVTIAPTDFGVGTAVVQVRRDNAGAGFKVGRNSAYLQTVQAFTDSEAGSGIGVRGVEARVERRTSTAKYAGYLQTSETRTRIWENVELDNILSLNGDMAGGWLAADATGRSPYYLTFADGQMSAQFQAINDKRLFCVKAVFVQNGGDVDGYVEYARYVDLPANGVDLGFDFDSGDSRIGEQKIQTGDSGSGYGGYGLKNVSALLIPPAVDDRSFVWKGYTANGNLSDPNNWVGGVAPSEGGRLYFRDPTPMTLVNDFEISPEFEGLYFAGSGSNAVVLTGNRLVVSTVDNLSETAKVRVEAPIVCGANFEPYTGGGLAIDSLSVNDTLAPRGKTPLGPLGTVSARMLSGGNIQSWMGAVYGLGGAFVRQTLSGSANATFTDLDTSGFTREVFEIAGTNTVANRVDLPNGQIFAVSAGVTSVADLGASGDDPHVNLAAGTQLHVREYQNPYARPIRFEGQGRISFGATGYAAAQADVFDGVTFATDGQDYEVAGSITAVNGTVKFAPVDPDGTERTIRLTSSAVSAGTTLELSQGGTLKVSDAALEGRAVTVTGGTLEPTSALSRPQSLTFSGRGGLAATEGRQVAMSGSVNGNPGTYRFAAGSSIRMESADLDLTDASIVYSEAAGASSDVLIARTITGVPREVVSAKTGRRCSYSVREEGGLMVLSIDSAGLMIMFK